MWESKSKGLDTFFLYESAKLEIREDKKPLLKRVKNITSFGLCRNIFKWKMIC